MKFFRRKDKRKTDGGGSFDNGKHSTLAHGGYGFGGSRSDTRRPFGSPPSGPYDPDTYSRPTFYGFPPTAASAALLARLPAAILERIFVSVCPHSRDETYSTCEQSSVEDTCMLCDLRDLSRCVAVCRRWKEEAVKLLYYSIRIDSVHYCELEAVLAERRKRRSFFDRNGQPEDPARARLKLLCRTLREDPVRRGRLVHYLKMPYMLRESSQADLARTIAVTPNLRYVDLPEGLFADDPAFLTLRLEVQARCLELRKMTYTGGSENSLQALATGKVWTKLEVLELIRIEMEPGLLRHVLGCLGNLRALKLILTDVPNVTCEGLKSWLTLPKARQALRVLTLNGTGARAWALHELLSYTPNLRHLSLTDRVSATLPAAAGSPNIPPLSSTGLESLHFEITAAPSTPKYSNVSASYYSYLANSLLSGGLPNLRAVYVRDPDFPDLLLGLPPPAPAYAEGRAARPASSGSASPFPSPFAPPSAPFAAAGGRGHRTQGSLPSLSGPFGSSSASLGTSPNHYNCNYSNNNNHNPRFSSNNPFAALASSSPSSSSSSPFSPPVAGRFMNLPAKLEVFTKGEDDDPLGWSFVQVGSGGATAAAASASSLSLPLGGEGGGEGRGGGGGGRGPEADEGGDSGRGQDGGEQRPFSSYGLAADVLGGSAAGWSGGAGVRRSVLISGAAGMSGFLAVPPGGGDGGRREDDYNNKNSSSNSHFGGGGGGSLGEDEWPRARSGTSERKRERMDLWR
ncbi:hypothetical protein VTH06DRAFT_6958 [Thermothelomyces fergusii]